MTLFFSPSVKTCGFATSLVRGRLFIHHYGNAHSAGGASPSPTVGRRERIKKLPLGEDSLRRREMSAKPTEGGVESCHRQVTEGERHYGVFYKMAPSDEGAVSAAD